MWAEQANRCTLAYKSRTQITGNLPIGTLALSALYLILQDITERKSCNRRHPIRTEKHEFRGYDGSRKRIQRTRKMALKLLEARVIIE